MNRPSTVWTYSTGAGCVNASTFSLRSPTVYITTPDINAPPTAADQGLIIGVSFVSPETLLARRGSNRHAIQHGSRKWHIDSCLRKSGSQRAHLDCPLLDSAVFQRGRHPNVTTL